MMRTMEYLEMRSNKRHGRPQINLPRSSDKFKVASNTVLFNHLSFPYGNIRTLVFGADLI